MKLKLLTSSIAVFVALTVGFMSLGGAPASAASDRILPVQNCLPDGSVRVSFQWEGNEITASQQWVDLSLFNNGWLPGTFLGAGPLPGVDTSLTWDGLISKTTHYVRVNQLLSSGWDPSPTFMFTTIDCRLVPPPPVDESVRTDVTASVESLAVVKISEESYSLVVRSSLPNGCVRPGGVTVERVGDAFFVTVYNSVPTDNRSCTQVVSSYNVAIPLGKLEVGTEYLIGVNGQLLRYTAE